MDGCTSRGNGLAFHIMKQRNNRSSKLNNPINRQTARLHKHCTTLEETDSQSDMKLCSLYDVYVTANNVQINH
jgi:hypothetical protein